MSYLTPEQLMGIKHFVPEAVQSVVKNHKYPVFISTGQTIESLIYRWLPSPPAWLKYYPDFRTLTSSRTQISIPPEPEEFFLLETSNMTLERQNEEVRKLSNDLYKEFPYTRREIGEAADYLEVFTWCSERFLRNLFREQYAPRRIRTKTRIVGNSYAYISYDPETGLYIGYFNQNTSHPNTFAAPLIVPE